MIEFFKGLFKSVFPQRCAYCGRVVSVNTFTCDECAAALPRINSEICVSCGREKTECSCNGEKYYSAVAAPFYYEGVVRRGVHHFKFRNWRQHSEAYGIEMAKTVKERFADKSFDFILPAPMTKKSLRKRGYNQVEILAETLSQKLGIECRKNVLRKIYETDKQHSMSYLMRKGNLTGVFDVSDPELVKGKRILLCDDISTSGETLNECAKMLWLCGADEVCCICFALTKPKKKK